MKGINEKIQQIRREISRRQEFYRGVLWRIDHPALERMVLENKAWLESIDALVAGMEEPEVQEVPAEADLDDGWIRQAPVDEWKLEGAGIRINLRGSILGKGIEPSSLSWSQPITPWQVCESNGWRRVYKGNIYAKVGEPCDMVSTLGRLFPNVKYGDCLAPSPPCIHAIRFH